MSAQLNEYQTEAHVQAYLNNAEEIPHRREGEAVVLELLPAKLGRVLDLGAGDGRLLAIIKEAKDVEIGIATDFSEFMLNHARERFLGDSAVSVVHHDLNDPLPASPPFDAIVSSFAIHHVSDERKCTLYQEIFDLLKPGGVFCNLEHVSSPTEKLHEEFYQALGATATDADPSNQCTSVEVQLNWLRHIGFADVDCFWKWRELALLAGSKPMQA